MGLVSTMHRRTQSGVEEEAWRDPASGMRTLQVAKGSREKDESLQVE